MCVCETEEKEKITGVVSGVVTTAGVVARFEVDALARAGVGGGR